jgi:hypothetical protein
MASFPEKGYTAQYMQDRRKYVQKIRDREMPSCYDKENTFGRRGLP